jgi:integrase
MSGSDTASSRPVRRSRRPQARLETSCTRTGRPRRHLRSKQTAGRRAKARATRPVRTSARSHTAGKASPLMTGEREQEVMYTYWTDINLSHATVRVSHKPDRNWTPKAYKEREIPIPAKLVASLKAWKATRDKKCNLVFPTSGCNPKLDFLDCLKACAERSGLDRENFWLHKFRSTFATWSPWAGVDLRTVQQWLGHSDMQSTMRYLKPSRSQQVREKVNEIFS